MLTVEARKKAEQEVMKQLSELYAKTMRHESDYFYKQIDEYLKGLDNFYFDLQENEASLSAKLTAELDKITAFQRQLLVSAQEVSPSKLMALFQNKKMMEDNIGTFVNALEYEFNNLFRSNEKLKEMRSDQKLKGLDRIPDANRWQNYFEVKKSDLTKLTDKLAALNFPSLCRGTPELSAYYKDLMSDCYALLERAKECYASKEENYFDLVKKIEMGSEYQKKIDELISKKQTDVASLATRIGSLKELVQASNELTAADERVAATPAPIASHAESLVRHRSRSSSQPIHTHRFSVFGAEKLVRSTSAIPKAGSDSIVGKKLPAIERKF